MWDFSIQTNHVIEDRRQDLIGRTCRTIDLAVPGDSRIEEKWKEKTAKSQRPKKGVTEDLECECEDYTISCGLFRCCN